MKLYVKQFVWSVDDSNAISAINNIELYRQSNIDTNITVDRMKLCVLHKEFTVFSYVKNCQDNIAIHINMGS